MNNFWNELNKQQQNIYGKKRNDVLAVIEKSKNNIRLSLDDFVTLISPAAAEELDTIALLSRQKTQKRFGKTIQLYIPLYLSNYCTNNCLYCGFNAQNHIKRTILTDKEILKEAETLKQMGYEHILLVTGENSKIAGVKYLLNAIKLVKPYFASISAEIQPLEIDEYKLLIAEGLSSVYVYQETYNKEKYLVYHPIGKKSDYHYRLDTPERLGTAGIYRIGLGILLGLESWREDAISLALHLQHLQKKYWRTKYSLSFPRIRPNVGKYKPNYPVNDKEFAQLIWAFRLFGEDVEIALTTRESVKFRNNMLTLGITSMSAGSKTEPGGYNTNINELEQFEVNDNRTPQELIQEIARQNYTAIWKDWDNYLGK